MPSHASGVTRTHDGLHSLVHSSTSAGSLPVAFGRPPQLVCVVATSQVEGAFGRVVVAVVRCSHDGHPNTTVCIRSCSSTSAGSLPVAFGRPPRLACVASTLQVEGAFGLVVVAMVSCCQCRHPNHDGPHSVVLIDVRRIPSGRLRTTAEARMRRIDFAGGGRLRSRRRRRGGVLPRPSSEPRWSAFGRPLRPAADPFRSPSDDHGGSYALHRLGRCRAPSVSSSSAWRGATRAVTGRRESVFGRAPRHPPGCLPVAFGLVVVAAVWCLRFISGAAADRLRDSSEAARKAKIPESKTEGKIKGKPLI